MGASARCGVAYQSQSKPKRKGFTGAILPNANAKEAAIVDELNVYPVETLQEAVQFLNGERTIEPFNYDISEAFRQHSEYMNDFLDVKGTGTRQAGD